MLIANLFDAVKYINSVINEIETINKIDLEILHKKMNEFFYEVLGLKTIINENNLRTNKSLHGTLDLIIDIRNNARLNNDFKTSDKIRDRLLKLGIKLKDNKEGTQYSIE